MGRPKEFDPDETLDKAMRLFWSKGYHDTSIRDLVEHTGVNYYGLYDSFDSKHGLLLAALDRYRDKVTKELLKDLQKPDAGLPEIRRSFMRMIDMKERPPGRVGCLMCNTAVELAPFDAAAAAKVKDHIALFTKAYRSALLSARAAGQIPAGKDPDALAAFLANTAFSVPLLMRAGNSRSYVKRHIETALSALA